MRNCVHFCDFSLQIKIAPRKTRSILIPIATSITPISSQSQNRAEKKSLAATVRKTDTTMVNFTSPAARSPLPSEPANGYICVSIEFRLNYISKTPAQKYGSSVPTGQFGCQICVSQFRCRAMAHFSLGEAGACK